MPGAHKAETGATTGATVRGLALAAALCGAPALAADAPITLPSGRAVAFNDVIWGEPGPAGLTVRFRFLQPDLKDVVAAIPYEELEADMHFLCESYAVERISNIGPQPSTVMISIADKPVDFGAADPDVTQVFEAYSRDGEACIWEGF